jgi:uroporphyrinogen decarboxylase
MRPVSPAPFANSLFKSACLREPQLVPPIWMMRQAGRYHRHYQELKKRYSFVELCKVPELAAETAAGPVEDFDFDVAILFSDLLFPLEALGIGLKYDPGPQLEFSLTRERLASLANAEEATARLEFQKHALRATRQRLAPQKSLIGFIGGPWTLFTYAVEGAHKGNLERSKSQLGLFDEFCEQLVPLLRENLRLQFEGGAEVIMVMDTAAGELAPDVYHQRVWPKLVQLAAGHSSRLGYYIRGCTGSHLTGLLNEHSEASFAGLGVDHRFDLASLLKEKRRGFLQSGLDQALLFGSREDFDRAFNRWFDPIRRLSPSERAGWVCGVGHGLLPGTPEEHVRLFVNRVRQELSRV